MRKNFNSTSRSEDQMASDGPRKSMIDKIVASNLGVLCVVGLPMAFVTAASAFGPELGRKPDARIPGWVGNYTAKPNGRVCTITDVKTGEEFISREGKSVKMPRGFSVASSPSSCNVTAPNKTTCQLRGWPIEPIC